MAYQTPKTIREVLESIRTHDYVLPAIQREFVWKQEQITRLFDSLLRAYPMGAFLLWQVDADRVGDYVYYDFVRDFQLGGRPNRNRRTLPFAGPGTLLSGNRAADRQRFDLWAVQSK